MAINLHPIFNQYAVLYNHTMMKYILSFIFLIAFLPATILAQTNYKLAKEYYDNGEYEKAATMFEKLTTEQPNNSYYFSQYLKCLSELEEYDKAEKILSKRIKADNKNSELYLEYGNLLEAQFKSEEADGQYRKAINLLQANQGKIDQLARKFAALTKYDLAVETYEKGNKILKDEYKFSFQIADIHRRNGNIDQMIVNYLNSLEFTPNRMSIIQTYLQRYLNEEDFGKLRAELYERIQEKPDVTVYPELLTWLFVQRKDFKNAFRQVKALDRRLKENGGRVYKLATNARLEKDYDAAIMAYEYILEEKGKNGAYYLESKREALSCKRLKLTKGYKYTQEDLDTLEQDYVRFLDEFGRDKRTANIARELSQLQALYMNDLNKAIPLLEEIIEYPGVERYIQARCKLDLGDFYLMKDEIWESTLLYSQVDKAFKDDIIGEEARYRNAKLSYFSGDFEWAQAQLSVLKAATSELISNDAIDLSVFIMDHYSLDTTATPMIMYAKAELLSFQNKFEGSFEMLDSIKLIYPDHGLLDDIYYAKSKIFQKKREYTKAADMLQRIIDEYPEEIRADNALFELGELYEKHLDDKDKAKDLYQRILMEHSGSTFAVEARKRFRALRGDGVQ